MLLKIDSLWRWLGQNATQITTIYVILGLIAAATSVLIGVHDVQWDGKVLGTSIEGLNPGVIKQVGYVWAPNWGLAGFVLLPLAIFHVLSARAGVEPMIKELIARDMLQRTDGTLATESDVMAIWRRDSTFASFLAFAIFLFLIVFIMYGDYYQVVLAWTIDPNTLTNLFASEPDKFRLSHSSYEFDWSIAALFDATDVNADANTWFSLYVYLLIPSFGAGLILSVFIWFFSVAAFFSPNRLNKAGFIIVPSRKSSDPRSGFEAFEEVFDHLVWSGIFTALLALTMHLQNVFLRSPKHENIFQMVFGDAIESFNEAVSKGSIDKVLEILESIGSVLPTNTIGTNIQIFGSAIAMFLLVIIVLAVVWIMLRATGRKGRAHLLNQGDLTEAEREKIEGMDVWPLGWVSLNLLLILIFVIFMAMYFVNLLALLVVALLGYAAKVIFAFAKSSFASDADTKKRVQINGDPKPSDTKKDE
ncbi:hypothetical protein [Epibacterium sp. Ofav1-8]|uniref:hypothetical protein n=1 Tax=Epibacterium sp. Ofav1-8 TaxID=2917735 RepID=UPI001EF5685D|nr:hypothetical protein [Epibacterium sp. Ofav1-8]MCG7625954.1 hypothetical protein [Epibacterium sp. Ofav1-8]